MNYFAHALPHLDSPYFVAGTAVPDWLSVADRAVRVRPRLARPVVETQPAPHRDVAAGVLRHFHDDAWFHATLAFSDLSARLAGMFRRLSSGGESIRAGFLGHIVTEMLLDAALIERFPDHLRRYYAIIDEVDPAVVEATVNRMARRQTQRLAPLIPHFVRERFLDDYADAPRLVHRLNQVLRRVKLAPLPGATCRVIDAARPLVAERIAELLPPRHYGLQLLERRG